MRQKKGSQTTYNSEKRWHAAVDGLLKSRRVPQRLTARMPEEGEVAWQSLGQVEKRSQCRRLVAGMRGVREKLPRSNGSHAHHYSA